MPSATKPKEKKIKPEKHGSKKKIVDPEADYVNPLDSSPRWWIYTRAYALRSAASLAFSLMHPADETCPMPTKTIWLDSTIGDWQGSQKISVDIWLPPGAAPDEKKLKRPAIINFHGGGFLLGEGTDDRRWVGAVMPATDAIIFSVNYRLAPGYPFPTPVEDSADAILQISSRAEEFGFDPERITLSGFSAGGSLCLASWVLLQEHERWGYKLAHPVPHIAGMCVFYPLLDWTISRPAKRLTCVRPERTLPQSMTDLFDTSYLYPPIPKEKRDDPRLSPGLMSDEMVDRLPPMHFCLCEHDMLLAEGVKFADRVRERGKNVTFRIVEGEKHAWDKPPPAVPKGSVLVEYGEAIQAMKSWIGQPGEGHDHIPDKLEQIVRLDTEIIT